LSSVVGFLFEVNDGPFLGVQVSETKMHLNDTRMKKGAEVLVNQVCSEFDARNFFGGSHHIHARSLFIQGIPLSLYILCMFLRRE